MSAGTFFSPSYIGDLERMVWLRRSIEARHDTPTRHVIAVPKQDLAAFPNALGREGKVEFIHQKDLVDSGFYPAGLFHLIKSLVHSEAWRLADHAGKPGWIGQQVVKLASNRLIEHGPIIFLDSDIFFYRRFSLEVDRASAKEGEFWLAFSRNKMAPSSGSISPTHATFSTCRKGRPTPRTWPTLPSGS